MTESGIRGSKADASKLSKPFIATGNPWFGSSGYISVDWGKISAYLAIFTLLGGALWQFADVYMSVRYLRDDVKELQRESEDLLRNSVETSARVTVLERSDDQRPHAMPSEKFGVRSCNTALPKP